MQSFVFLACFVQTVSKKNLWGGQFDPTLVKQWLKANQMASQMGIYGTFWFSLGCLGSFSGWSNRVR